MNFHELAEKLRKIDESQTLMETFEKHDFEKNNFSSFSTSGTPTAQVKECGPMPGMDMIPHGMPGMQPPQQDSVSMNVSMNAQGKGGIRDLMNVLKNIEDTVQGHTPMELPIGQEIEIDGPAGEIELDHEPEMHVEPEHHLEPEHHDDMAIVDAGAHDVLPADQHAIDPMKKMIAAVMAGEADGDLDEEFANRPNVQHQGTGYMTKALAGGLNKQHVQHQIPGQPNGTNPMKEGLLADLANLYQEVKLREGIIREEGPASFGMPVRPSPVTGGRPVSSGPEMPAQSVNRIPQNVKPQADRPGLDPKGDPKLYDIQAWLRKNGYKDSYGQPIKPDGVNGDRTKFAYDQAMNAHAQTQDLQNPDTASTAQKIGTSIGSGIDWIETAWRNLKKGFTSSSPSAPPSMNESNEIISLNKKLNG